MSEVVENKQKKSIFLFIGIGVAILYAVLNYLKFEFFSAHLAEMSIAAAVIFLIVLIIQFFVAQYSIRLNDGAFDFKKVFQAAFLVLLIYEIGFVLSNYVYIFYINPDFIQEFYDRNVIAVEEINKNWGEEDKKQALEAILNMKNVSISSMFSLYFKEVIFSSVFAFIIAFINKFLTKPKTPFIYSKPTHQE